MRAIAARGSVAQSDRKYWRGVHAAEPVNGIPVGLVVQNQGVPQDVRVATFGRTLARAGYTVEIIAPSRPGQAHDELIDGYTVHRFPEPPDGVGAVGYAWEVTVSLWRILRAQSRLPDADSWRILHLCNPPDVLWAPFATITRQAIRIYDHHDLAPELYLAKGGRPGSAAHRALLRMERWANHWADLVIVPNESYAAITASRGHVSPERIHVVRNAPRADIWYPVPRDESLREGADFVVCYVGSIGTQDGVAELIRAMSSVRKTDVSRKYLCLVVGSGAALPGLQELASGLGLTDTVRFLGWIGDARRVRDIIASSDVGIEPCPLNAFNASSTMIKLTEYLATGRPVVAYDLPEHRVTAGDAGVFVPPSLGHDGLARAIVQMAANPSDLKALADKAAQRLGNADLSDAVAERALLRAYDQARQLGRSRGAPW